MLLLGCYTLQTLFLMMSAVLYNGQGKLIQGVFFFLSSPAILIFFFLARIYI